MVSRREAMKRMVGTAAGAALGAREMKSALEAREVAGPSPTMGGIDWQMRHWGTGAHDPVTPEMLMRFYSKISGELPEWLANNIWGSCYGDMTFHHIEQLRSVSPAGRHMITRLKQFERDKNAYVTRSKELTIGEHGTIEFVSENESAKREWLSANGFVRSIMGWLS